MGDFTIQCNRESLRISCRLLDSDTTNQIIIKYARSNRNSTDVFLISLHFVEEPAAIKSDFGEQFNQQPKHNITEFADFNKEPQGLPPHRGHLNHHVKITGYSPRKRRNILSVPQHEELKRPCT